MKRSLYLVTLIISGLIYFSSNVAASQDDQAGEKAASPSGEEIVAMCEDKYSSDNYADETERANLVDKCINDSVDESESASEKG